MNTELVIIYTDGSCVPNPGIGGWAALLCRAGREIAIYGYMAQTTNNRMELLAALQALEFLKCPCKVQLFTDSEYLKNGMSLWAHNWNRQNWMTRNKDPVKNYDIWKQLYLVAQKHEITWHKIKAHAGYVGNEYVDELASQARREQVDYKIIEVTK